MRPHDERALEGVPSDGVLSVSDSPATRAAKEAIMQSIQGSCGVPLSEALDVQARHSAGFTVGSFCREGGIGAERRRTMAG